MFTTCYKCKKKNDYWDSRSLKEPIIVNDQELHGSFNYSKFFCPITERKVKDPSLPDFQEKILIVDCLNGDREEIREKVIK